MATANTQSLVTNLNSDPYYDDFDESKNFHRILAIPGLAVQAREFTQAQTMLQNQIDRFAEHIFKEGSVVSGMEFIYDPDLPFVKLRDSDSSNIDVDPSLFVGTTITGSVTGLEALVVDYKSGAESGDPDTNRLYVRYLNTGTQGTFTNNEILTANSGITANVLTSATATGKGSRITFGEGIVYTKDHFVRVPSQSIIVGDYSPTVSYRVGYDVQESIISSTEDSTLLDPARGAYNYNAPGCNRLKIDPVISRRDFTNANTASFIEMTRIKNGEVEFKADKPLYSQINDYIARRTFDESGNYIVSGLNVKLREHLNNGANNNGVFLVGNGGDSNKLSVDVSSGKAYVFGYEIDNLTTKHVPIDKGIDFEEIEQVTITSNYGNYINVNEVVGKWDINAHTTISLRDEAMNAISNNAFSGVTTVGNEIGTARVKALEYTSGDKGSSSAVYKLYLYDINMTANTFGDIKSAYFNTTESDGKADVILSSGSAILQETTFNTGVYQLPAGAIKTIRDISDSVESQFRFVKSFDVNIDSAGQFSLNTGSALEQYPFSTGALNDTQKSTITVIFDAVANTTTNITGTVGVNSNTTVTGSGTAFTTQVNAGEILVIDSVSSFVIKTIESDTSLTLETAAGTTSSGHNAKKSFKEGHIVNLAGGGTDGDRSVTIDSTIAASYDINESLSGGIDATVLLELNRVNAQEKTKAIVRDRVVQINISDDFVTRGATALTGPWNLGLSDLFKLNSVRLLQSNTLFTALDSGTAITSDFEIDNGQRDNLYSTGTLKLKSNSTRTVANGDVLLVSFDYFTHDTSQGKGYFSVDSYPIDDILGAANTAAIETKEIPLYESLSTGSTYDLRNSIDIRPRITDTANSVSTILNMTTNPAAGSVVLEDTGSSLRYFAPNESFIADLQYYLPRKDRVVLDKNGVMRAIRGTSSLFPITPAEPSDGMTIGVVEVAPYPSLTAVDANNSNRPGLGSTVKPERTRRYTMRDIGALNERIDNLEYYTSLSLLEADTKNFSATDSLGFERFKNGIVVDNFYDHTLSDLTNLDYYVSIDPKLGEMRPPFNPAITELEYDSSTSSNVVIGPNDIIVTITEGTATKNFTEATSTADGETITSGGASGKLRHQVDSTSGTTSKLYIEQVSGTFSGTVSGGTSGITATISSVSTIPSGEYATLPYTHSKIIEQPNATTNRNTAGLIYTWYGNVSLNPSQDFWLDTVRLPDNNTTNASSIGWNTNNIPAFGMTWGWWSWGWGWNQTPNSSTSVSTTRATGGGGRVINTTTRTNLGDRVVGTEILPFIRSQVIQFSGVSIKPSTSFFPFFDDEDVSSYCTPTDSTFTPTGNEGDALVSDSNGNVYGLFRIPNDDNLRFNTGETEFKLTDSITNSESIGGFTSFADTSFLSFGQQQQVQKTILTTRSVRVIPPPPQPSDPIAQTFRINDVGTTGNLGTPGMFLTKLDIYFQSKDDTQPVIIEIRETDPSTNTVTNRVVPFSTIIVPSADVNTSVDGSKPTPVYFSTPVYLLADQDYAIVVKPGGANPNYNVFVARMGEDDIITGERVSTNPFTGLLFASSNDRVWTAIQEEDLKFSAYFADFGVSQTGTVQLKNKTFENFYIDTVSSDLFEQARQVHGETTLSTSAPLSANIGEQVIGDTSLANGEITFISGSSIRVKDVTLNNKFLATENITLLFANGTSTAVTGTLTAQTYPTGTVELYNPYTNSRILNLNNITGEFASGTYIREQINGSIGRIASIEELPVDIANIFIGKTDLESTSVVLSARLATSTSTKESAYIEYNDNEDKVLNSRKYILTESQETAGLSGANSCDVKVSMSNATNRRHTPIADIKRSAILSVENYVNNDSTSETGKSGGDATARYITKTITLDEGQDAEDLKVLIGAYKPLTSSIKVYYKILNAEDSDIMDDVSWVEMDQTTLTTIYSDGDDKQDFKEFEFDIPVANLTGSNEEVQYTNSNGIVFTGFKYFSIKMVLLSSSFSNVPRIKDFRTIALQK